MAATAKAIFDGDAAKLDAVIKGIDRQLLALQARFATVTGFIAAAFALPAAAAAGIAIGVGKVLEVGGELNDLHNNTGIAIDDLVVLQEEFRQAGKAGEDVAGVIAKMQKALATGSADAEIRQLGFDLDALRAQTPLQQFQALGKAINGIPDPATRAAVAMAIFGKSGATLLSLFASQGFGNAAAAVGAQAEILKRDAALFDDAGDKLGTAGIKVQGFFVGVADRVIPPLTLLLDRMIGLDLSHAGQGFGQAITAALISVATGDVWKIMGLALMVSLGEAVNFLASGLLTAVGYMGGALVSLMDKIHTLLIGTFLDAVSVLDHIPGVKGYVKERRENLYASQDADARDIKSMTGIGKYGKLFDTSGLSSRIGDLISESLAGANALGVVARALHGGPADKGGGTAIDLLGGGGVPVTSLGRIGGEDYAGGGGDPLLTATQETNRLLKDIHTAVSRDRPGATPQPIYQ